jgi:hypothetical protein
MSAGLLELLQSYAWNPSTLAKPDSEAVSTVNGRTNFKLDLPAFER